MCSVLTDFDTARLLALTATVPVTGSMLLYSTAKQFVASSDQELGAVAASSLYVWWAVWTVACAYWVYTYAYLAKYLVKCITTAALLTHYSAQRLVLCGTVAIHIAEACDDPIHAHPIHSGGYV
jgi:hypothetical protein